MDAIFAALKAASEATNTVRDIEGRNLTLNRAIVTDNNDPEGKRRVKVSLASKGGELQSNWVRRLNFAPYIDEPLPATGQTVIVAAIDGNPHDLIYFGVQTNDTNQPLSKADAVEDSKTETPGNNTIHCGKSLRLTNDAGCYLELSETGTVILGDAYGHVWTLGGGTGGAVWSWNANGANINIVNASDMTINGKTIATVGAKDTRNDTIIERGW